MRPLILATVAILSGCAAQKPQGPMPTLDPPPVCYSDRQCEAMWSEAVIQASQIGGMRVQAVTDTYLQTYNPTGYGRLGAKVRKMPRPDGGTAIESRFECYYPCGDVAYKAVNQFTAKVKAAGEGFGPTSAPAAPTTATPGNPAPSGPANKEALLHQLRQESLPYEEYQRRYRQIMAE